MPQLDINGIKINIGDEFLKLSPQAQDAFVKNTIVPSAEFQAAQKGAQPAPATEPASRAWADVPLEAVKNIPSSAAHLVEGQVRQAANVAGYAVPKVLQHGLLAPAAMAIDAGKAVYQDPELLKKIPAAAWKALTERYGSEEALKKTIATDPVGFALDAATVIGGGEAAISRVARGVGEIGRAADVSRPFHEIPRAPEAPPPPPGAAPPPLEDPALMEVRAAVASQPRALTTESPTLQQAGQVVSKLPGIGGPVQSAIEAVPRRFGEARTAVADELGGYRTPQNIGEDVRQTLGGASEAEQAAIKAEAARSDAAAQAAYERTNLEREQAIAQREQASTQATQQQIGPAPTSTGMGETLIDATRSSHEAAQRQKNAHYDYANSLEGTIHDPAVVQLHSVVKGELRREGQRGRVALGPDTTPRAMEMNRAVKDFSAWASTRQAAAEAEAIAGYRAAKGYPEGYALTPEETAAATKSAKKTGVNLQEFEDFRKDLNAIYANVEKPADRRAANRIMKGVDDFQQQAMGSKHYVGDPNALPAFRQARASNRDLMERFGYNDRFAEDKIIQKIVRDGPTDHIGPNDVAGLLSAQPDKAGRVLDRLYEAIGDHPGRANVHQSIRGGLFNEASAVMKDGAARTPEAIAKDLTRLVSGKREGLASRIYSPADTRLILRHAEELRAGQRARAQAAIEAKANVPTPTEIVKGPAQQLAERILGKGEKPAEAIYSAIEDLAKSKGGPLAASKGGGKDIATLAKVMNNLPPELQGNFLNTFIRRIGEGQKGEPFSPAKFSTEWSDHINPMAKQVLLKNGAHVKALDELAAASKQFDYIHRKFGNASGSGHTGNFMQVAKIAAATTAGGAIAVLAPMKLLGGWFAGRQFSHFLATPQGAASASRFVRQMQKLQSAPTMANAAAANLAKLNMRNTATSLGIAHNIPETKK